MYEEEKSYPRDRAATPLDDALGRLTAQTERLEQNVELVIERLRDVLRPGEPGEVRGDSLATVRTTSPAVDRIEMVNSRLGDLADRLIAMRDRLDT